MPTCGDNISDAELEVMKVVWKHKAPTTYATIRVSLSESKGWDPSTIRTLVKRLVEKNVLIQTKRDVYYYTPAIEEDAFMKDRTEDFLRKVYNGDAKHLIATMLGHDFVTGEELRAIQEFWSLGREENE